MTPKIKLCVCLPLLLSCTNNRALELGEEPGNYKFPITKAEYAYTVYGFYVSRGTRFGDEIEYEVIRDMRQTRADLLRNYQVTDNLRQNYPSFFKYKGSTDCGKNTVTVEQLGASMDVLYSSVHTQMDDIARALCTLRQMSEKN